MSSEISMDRFVSLEKCPFFLSLPQNTLLLLPHCCSPLTNSLLQNKQTQDHLHSIFNHIKKKKIWIRTVPLDSHTNAYTKANLENFVLSSILSHARSSLFSLRKSGIKNLNIACWWRFIVVALEMGREPCRRILPLLCDDWRRRFRVGWCGRKVTLEWYFLLDIFKIFVVVILMFFFGGRRSSRLTC